MLGRNGYQEVRTPQVMDRTLWERSGHWENYREHMFTTELGEARLRGQADELPGSTCQIFNQGLKSYRDLPLRLAEFGSCHRNEPSGALHGIMRVRGFVQDDAHIFCTEDQVQAEAAAFIDLLQRGLPGLRLRGDPDQARHAAGQAHRRGRELGSRPRPRLGRRSTTKGLTWQPSPGEGAFYGPKIEFSLKDSIGRVWQCGTLAAGFRPAGPARRRVRGRGQQPQDAGDAASGDPRVDGALHRHPHRAPCRSAAAVAVAGAGRWC